MRLMSDDERRELFIQGFSEDFLQDAIRTAKTVYSGSDDECKRRYEKPERHFMFPNMRRAELEKELATLAKTRYPEIKVEPRQNKKNSSWYRLFSSKGVLLTVSALPNPNRIVRPAAFREEYATCSQYNLSFDEEIEPPPDDAEFLLYSILAHGADRQNKGRPAFIDIKFPNKECTKYVGEIRLFDRYATLVNSLWQVSEERIEDDLKGFGLRADAREQAQKDRDKDRKKEQEG